MRKYQTIQGDTWDKIAYKVYEGLGGEKLTHILLDANSDHLGTVIFSAGVELNVPEVYAPASRSLPPWMA